MCAAMLLAALLCLLAPIVWAAECAPGQHKYDEIRHVPATAMEDGTIDYLCSVCGHAYTRRLLATDHLWDEWIIDKPATCTEPGSRHRTCTRTQPSHTETAVIPALGHKYKETRVEPTCFEPGKSVFVCENDPAHTYEEPIPAPGSHSFGEWRTETPVGEGVEGLEGLTEPKLRCRFPVKLSGGRQILFLSILGWRQHRNLEE